MLFSLDPLMVFHLRRHLTRGGRAFARRLGMPAINVRKVSLMVLGVVLLVVALTCVEDYRRTQAFIACDYDDIFRTERPRHLPVSIR